ncbi:SpoIIE family protein phosphatase [Modestobacter versicolor]|uniref:Histidine kinase n=1 Tax=Modestobacter versicolor TaxID=429133 RepID=A0A323VGW1_9ACTN|nr:SpoIIE family protein phosphatase [Modestobacter versicolor]MBB3674679.1 PAS domain S-box-containing protein [Modestobacter versicolor]PZA23253.1 histidine kinase [Modestobacter versicolor]
MSEYGDDASRTRTSELAGGPGEARRALLDLAVTAAGVGMFDWVLAADDLGWDERLIELFGYDPATFDQAFAAFTDRVHPEDVDRVTGLLQDAVDTVGEYSAEYRVVLPDGGIRWLAARGRALADEAGRTVRVIGAAWDVTERRAEQERIAQIVDSMAVGFIAVDHDWVITHVNTEAERITGYPREQLLGRDLWDQFSAAVGTEFERSYRRAAATGQTQALDAYYPEPLDVWVEVRAVPGPAGLALHFVDITARALAVQQAERAAAREQLLSRITEELAGTLDADDAATRLARLITPAVADWCIVTLIEDTSAAGDRRGLRTAASWHTDPAMRDTVEAYAQSRLSVMDDDAIVVRALRTGQPQHLPTGAAGFAEDMLAPGLARDLVDVLAPEAVLVMPLPGRTGPVGLLTVCNGARRGPFSPEDLVSIRHVAARAGLVLDNARLYRQQRDLAEGFQRSLLTAPPQPDHLQIVVRYVPAAQAAEVGGDWYDAFLQPAGATVLVIGDVVGHDTQAAAAMGQIRTVVRTLGAHDDDGPAAVVAQADQVMHALQSAILATAVVARLEQTDDEHDQGLTRLRWSNAGHPPPLVLTPDGQVELLATERADLLLGVDPSTTRRESVITVQRETVVLLYTDGLVERRSEDLDHGLARLQAIVAELAGRDLDELVDEVLDRMLPAIPDDDVALIAVRLHRQDQPRPPEAGPNRLPPDVPAA